MFSQGNRNDILRELELLENPNAEVEESTLTPEDVKCTPNRGQNFATMDR